MVRWISAVTGLLLIAVAFFAGSAVADTRQGLIAEIVALLAGLAGISLLLYGLVPKRPAAPARAETSRAREERSKTRSANDLLVGVSGLLLAAVLLGGLAVSGGWTWAALGGVLLLPMVIGCGYLCFAFARAPERDWRIDLAGLAGHRN
jgi:hypothetical protein